MEKRCVIYYAMFLKFYCIKIVDKVLGWDNDLLHLDTNEAYLQNRKSTILA